MITKSHRLHHVAHPVFSVKQLSRVVQKDQKHCQYESKSSTSKVELSYSQYIIKTIKLSVHTNTNHFQNIFIQILQS